MAAQMTSLTIGLDDQDRVHVQAFFPVGPPKEEIKWEIGWVQVGHSPNLGLGLHKGDPTDPIAVIDDKERLKKIVVSLINEGGFQADTFQGEVAEEKRGGDTVLIGKPVMSSWVSLNEGSMNFFLGFNDMLNE